MIPKPQLLSIATESGLLPTTVEKDYVLGWMLTGISRHPALSQWSFKGGTCLKKCFFETYRFSEDLDFTVPEGGLYSREGIQNALIEMTTALTDETGIQFPREGIEVKESINKRGKQTFVAKVTFVGPLNQPKSIQQRIKFDLTQDEILVDGASVLAVSHPYSDALSPAPSVRCYTINEILAEKTRAIYERQGTPRDIYDVVNIGRNFRSDVDPERARKVLREKFKFKGLPEPKVETILAQADADTIRANWTPSLGHQLRTLPPVDSFIADLKESLAWWIEQQEATPAPPPISASAAETTVPRERFIESYTAPPMVRLGRGVAPSLGLSRGSLETIRFAARNRLLVGITYSGIYRVVEPYSLRLPKTGNVLLYVFEVSRGGGSGGGIKAYNVSKIAGVQVTPQTFRPRFLVEL